MENPWSYTKKYRPLYLVVTIAMVVSILLDTLAPQITRHIIDDVVVGRKRQLLFQLLFGLVGIGLRRAVLQYVKEFIFDYAAVGIGSRLREDLFDHIQTLFVGYFDSHNTGELMTRVKDDVDRIWNACGYVGMLVLECTFHAVIVMVCMFRISPILTLLPVVVMPLIAWSAIRMENGLGAVYDKISEETAELNTAAQENLAGVRTMKAFTREECEIEKFKKHNCWFYKLNMDQAQFTTKYQPGISFLSKVLLLAVIVFGGILVIRGQITTGQLGAFSEYANNIIWPMEMVGWLSNNLAAAMASNRKIKKIMAEKPDIREPEMPVASEKIEGKLSFDHVNFDLYGNRILSDITFSLEPGGTLGIMGVTGSGKTSVVNLIQRFCDMSRGRTLLDGTDIRRLPLKRLRSSTAVVTQDVFLLSDSISENVKAGGEEVMLWESVKEAVLRSGASEFIDELTEQYDTVIGERGVGLPGGQKQRISIARAMAKRAPIPILDDSTSALDMETEKMIEGHLSEMKDCSRIITAHRVSAVRHADEILILDGGRIIGRGTHEELMALKGQYYKTYQVQYGEGPRLHGQTWNGGKEGAARQ